MNKIRLLGTFEVERGARLLRPEDWPRKKAAGLLKRLAYERRLVKDQAMESLWPEAGLAHAANNLYKTIHILRQTLDQGLGAGSAAEIFDFEDGILSLGPGVWVDAHEFERYCASSVDAAEDAGVRLKRALELYQGDLLPDDRYEQWTLLPRESLHRCQREARLELAAYLTGTQDYAQAVALMTPLLAHDPADEVVHRELMRSYALSGQRHAALRQYQACVRALAEEVDAPPSPETEALYVQILQGELSPPILPVKPRNLLPGTTHDEGYPPSFAGRAREMSELQAHLRAAVDGEGGVLFISGEAGQGKTRLMAQFAARSLAGIPDLVAAAGTCQSLIGISDPYLPFRELAGMLSGEWERPWLGGRIPDLHRRRLQAIAPQVNQAMRSIAPDLVQVFAPARRREAQSRPLELNQYEVFDQFGRLLREAASRQPLLLILDDLQWIDPASANLLFYLGRQLSGSAVLLLGAYRPSEVNSKPYGDHPLAAVVHELTGRRGNIRIDLDASEADEGRSFIDALLDSEPNRLDTTFREALYRRTRGHPLFTAELLRALQNQGELSKDSRGMWTAADGLEWGLLPARVEAVIARRIEALPEELRQILAVASVEGESFTVEVIAQVLERPVRPLIHRLSQELDHRFRLVQESGEWRPGREALTRYQFRHNLFQQYLYQQLGEAERRRLHAEIAAVLEQAGEADRLAVFLAQHYLAANNPEKALPYLCRAGDEARRRVALEDAARFYRSALDHWPQDDPTNQAEILTRLAETLLALGRAHEAIESLEAADRLYAQTGEPAGRGATQRLIGRSYWELGARAKAMEHYHRALDLLEQAGPEVELARALSAIGQMHMLANQFDEAIHWSERALSLAQALEAEDVIVHAQTTLGTALAATQDVDQGLRLIATSQARAEALGLPHDTGRAYAAWSDTLVNTERYEEALAVYRRMLDYARKVHAGMFEGVALVQMGLIAWWTGRWGQTWTILQAIREWMEKHPQPSMAKVWASNLLGLVYNDLGLPGKAEAALKAYTEIARSAEEPQTTIPHLAELARCTPREDVRAGLMQEILAAFDAVEYPHYESLPALRLACSWLAQESGGDPAALDRLAGVRQRMPGHYPAASFEEARAYAAALRGDWTLAADASRAAAAHWETLQRPFDRLRALAATHQALVQQKAPDASRETGRQMKGMIVHLASELADPEIRRAFLDLPWLRVAVQSR